MNRLGIELTPSHCRLVEVVAPRTAGHDGRPDVRVTAFATIAHDDPAALARDLRALIESRKLSRRAWVALWGVPGAHQGGDAAVAAVAAGDVRRLIEPITDAGIAVDGVVTPPLALAALARLRTTDAPNTVGAFLAVNRDLMGLAFVRDGQLLFAREMPWGHRGSVDRDAFATRLSAELKRSILFFKQTFKTDVSHVVICGDLPDVRVLTAPLITALDVEVETADSLDGIDMRALPSPAPEFREQVASLRLAWAVASDGAHPINLLPGNIVAARTVHGRRLTISAAAAAAAAICGALFWQADAAARAEEEALHRAAQSFSQVPPGEARRAGPGGSAGAPLEAIDSQGPRLARALEAIARTTPAGIVLHTVTMKPAGASWRATIGGLAVARDHAAAAAMVSEYLRALQESKSVGTPLGPPAVRMKTAPSGMPAADFTAEFEIRP